MYVVYTEIHENGQVERWYYGTYDTSNRANEVALMLGGEWPIYHCVCDADKAKDFGIQNLPKYLQ